MSQKHSFNSGVCAPQPWRCCCDDGDIVFASATLWTKSHCWFHTRPPPGCSLLLFKLGEVQATRQLSRLHPPFEKCDIREPGGGVLELVALPYAALEAFDWYQRIQLQLPCCSAAIQTCNVKAASLPNMLHKLPRCQLQFAACAGRMWLKQLPCLHCCSGKTFQRLAL